MRTGFAATVCGLLLTGVLVAHADTTVTVTQNNEVCKVTPPDEVTAPVTPNAPAGVAAEKNNNFALAWANFRALAEKGDVAGERFYGMLLLRKCTGLQDEAAGVSWLGKAADAGDMQAQADLARAYMNGHGAAQDDGQAFLLMSKAAASGDPAAEADLGYLYLSGRGVPQNLYEGMVWTVKAGEKGAPAALFNIAQGYFRGEALPQDADNSVYYLVAGVQRSTPLQRARFAAIINNVTRSVSTDRFQHIAARARRWSPGEGSLSDVVDDVGKARAAALHRSN